MTHKIRASLGVILLGLAVVVSSLSLTAGPASAGELEYSTDAENPTYVTEVPEGFEPSGDPVSETNDCVTQTVQVYSKTVLEGYEPAVEETFSYGYEERTRSFNPGQDEVSHFDYTYKKPKLVEQHKYEKSVTGVVEKRNKNSNGSWTFVSNFGPVDYPDAGPLGWGVIPNPMSGGHNDIIDQDREGNFDYRWRTTNYQYVIVDTRTVQDGWEYSGTVHEALGSPWVLLTGPTKHVTTEYVAPSYGEWSAWTTVADELPEEPTLPENTDVHEYRLTEPVSNEDGRPEVPGTEVTYFVYTSTFEGQSCPTTTEEPTTTVPVTTEAPTTTAPAETSSTSTVAPTTTAAPAAAAAPAELAYTGFNFGIFLAGLGLLAAGAILVFAGRRRTA